MSMREYFERYHGEVDRIRTLYHEARRLGQDERVKELADELHNFAFNHYQLTCKQVEIIEKMMKTQTDPRLLKVMEGFRDDLSHTAGQQAQTLDKFVFDFLRFIN
ncbi:MAG: hypothetical protein HYS80_01505 [Candidatus Aenigmarchaeota archaeon]|nr:hypothetical protein [Candidatus Aenigmarchaeota archaeon]